MKSFSYRTILCCCCVYLLFITSCSKHKPSAIEQIWLNHPTLAPAVVPFNDGYFLPLLWLDEQLTIEDGVPALFSFMNDKNATNTDLYNASLTDVTAMAVADSILYISVGSQIKAYHVTMPDSLLGSFSLPDSNNTIHSLCVVGELLLATTPETGNIYVVDLSDTLPLERRRALLYYNVPRAGAMLCHQEALYVAATHGTAPDSLYYDLCRIAPLDEPQTELILNAPGTLASLAISEDGSTIYFVNCANATLYSLELETSNLTAIDSCAKYTNPTAYFLELIE